MTYVDQYGESYEGSESNVEWWTWSDALYDSMLKRYGDHRTVGLAHLEQKAFRSHAEKRCCDCGDPGHAEYDSVLFPSAKTYWQCKSCDDRQKAKYAA